MYFQSKESTFQNYNPNAARVNFRTIFQMQLAGYIQQCNSGRKNWTKSVVQPEHAKGINSQSKFCDTDVNMPQLGNIMPNQRKG